ncbi:LamG domain-containing protein [Actinomadura sp. KC06]|uniref:LamG domain-containing protein n=1 Tax=Actinomadura sp. KC06 TaxID=2530369 RepID=UPI001049EEEA|nr:LamG domain-containing protein [Actinomadura sp. KC06]TDD38535.1 LamG domain-containing protein [Actinomadura sp. KC06]
MRPRRTIQVLLAAFAVAVPTAVAGSAGVAAAESRTLIPAPTVTSTDYPDDDAWHGTVGQYGNFTFEDPSKQAARYVYTINGSRYTEVPTEAGAPVTVPIAPERSGPNILEVGSFGPNGENGPRTTYVFRVKAGTAAKARWKLDEPAGARRLAAETREGEGPVAAWTVGRVTTGADGQLGTAASFTGGQAVTRPVVDTTKSFSMSAWARPARDGDSVVIAATGRLSNAFALQSRGGHWAFVMTGSDSRGAATAQAVAERPVYRGTWAHLVGSYDATKKRLRLYVNGALASDAPAGDSAWNARGPLRIGAGAGRGAFHGDLDEVRVFDRMIVADEAAELPKVPKRVHGRWKFNADGADDSTFGNHMALRGGAVIDPNAGFPWTSPAGLMLNGTGAHAEAAGPVIRTDRSFTIAAHANTEQAPAKAVTLLSLSGENVNRFAVRFLPTDEPGWGRWQLVMADDDTAGARTSVAEQTTYAGWWDHIAVVYDAPTRTMRLYVNGDLDESRSVKHDVGAFDAKGALQVGRSAIGDPEHWTGAVDDVWAFQGALTWEQLAMLNGGMEIDTMEWLD